MIGRAFLLALALTGRAAAAPAWNAPAVPGIGVLLLGEGGDHDWRAQIELVEKAFGRTPVAFAAGGSDARALQQAVSTLEDQPARIKKIVAVPLYESSFADILDEDRFLLGIREKPPAGAAHAGFGRPRRVRTKLPIVLTKALDDHPLLVEMLAQRALRLTKDPSKDALLLVGLSPASTDSAKEWLTGAAALAEKVRQKAGFGASRAAALIPGASFERREQSLRRLRSLVAELKRKGLRVDALSLEPTAAQGRSEVGAALSGLFIRLDARGLLPDPKIAEWVLRSAQEAAKFPDMRHYR